VAPIYGRFIVGGALLGMIFFSEPTNLHKLVGIGLAALSVFLIATSTRAR
jgi:multidrug transporter EmrE-like cation transporter